MNFQERLKMCRKQAGYSSAKDFAKALGVPYPSYMAYENKGREPKYEILCKIADTLNVSIDYLIGHEPSEFNRLCNILNTLGFQIEKLKDNRIKIKSKNGFPYAEMEQEDFIKSVQTIVDQIISLSNPLNSITLSNKIINWLHDCWRKSRNEGATAASAIHLTPEEKETLRKYEEMLKQHPNSQAYLEYFGRPADEDTNNEE